MTRAQWKYPSTWKLSLYEILFFLPTLALSMAFELYGDNFGKRGIPIQLPSGFGTIPNFQPKLFPMEIYLCYLAILTLTQIRRWPRFHFWNRLTALVLFLVSFGVLRALPDLRANPILVVRNLAFLWYLALPLMIALFPIPSLRWERFFQVLYLISFAYFIVCLLNPFLDHDPKRIFWFIDLGLMFALAYGLTAAGKWPARVALVSIGFLLGLAYFGSVQRTTFVGLCFTLALLILSPVMYGKFPRPRWRRVVWLAGGLIACVAIVGGLHARDTGATLTGATVSAITGANPGRIAETNASGVEQFRSFLWKDAFQEFVTHPLAGIGFLEPVVKRVYAGAGAFLENNGSFEYASMGNFSRTTPPISGPHNSYLNALARMGIAGAGVLVLHVACAWLFLTRCYFACFFILVWQMIYAFFNVSLEGPIRSFPLLVLIGVALKLAIERTGQITEGSPLDTPKPSRGSARRGGRVGLVHVPYRFVGGEDLHVLTLEESYRSIGIEPVLIPKGDERPDLLLTAARSLTLGDPSGWDELLREHSIDFLHINNIHAALGPAFLRWVIERRIPALMTVHNHRFYCTNGLALYGAEVCKACRPRASFLRPIVRNCNDSLPKTIYHSAALVEIRGDDLLRRAVAQFLAPSPYIARELQFAGVEAEKIRLFPHPVSVEVSSRAGPAAPNDVAFVGRLSPEKGVMHLLAAARKLPARRFSIVGEGPLESEVRMACAALPNVRFLGKTERSEALAVMGAARVVCVPSVCHESFSLVAAEAASMGARLVVPDSASFVHYLDSPFEAVTAIVSNPESLAYSIETALSQPRRTHEEIREIRDRFSLENFRQRLQSVVNTL